MQISEIANSHPVFLSPLYIQSKREIDRGFLYLLKIHNFYRFFAPLIEVEGPYMSRFVKIGTHDESRMLTDIPIHTLSFRSLPGDGTSAVGVNAIFVCTGREHIPEHDWIPTPKSREDAVLAKSIGFHSEILCQEHAFYTRCYTRSADPISRKYAPIRALFPIQSPYEIRIRITPDIDGGSSSLFHAYHCLLAYREDRKEILFCYRSDTSLSAIIINEICRRICLATQTLCLESMLKWYGEMDATHFQRE